MSSEMTVTLKTLTPLWTGGVEGKMDRIHETGILGSLRWWYEAIVRGLGGRACDPSKHECGFNSDRYCRAVGKSKRERLQEAGLCDVCQIFGATGWQRRFRLGVVKDDTKPTWEPADRLLNIRPPGRNRGWFLPPGQMGTLRLRLDGDERTLSLLAALFLFLEQWGSIGAKPQLGYGVFRIENRDEVQTWAVGSGEGKPSWEWKVLGDRVPGDNLPDLRRFGFLRYRFSPVHPGWWTRVPGMERVASQVQPLVSTYKTVPVVPALKNEWRFHRWRGSKVSERAVFGSLRPERQRSRVTASWAYQKDGAWEVRGWVWLPSRQQWANAPWELLTERESWEAVLRVHGNLKTLRPETKEQVVKLLEEAK